MRAGKRPELLLLAQSTIPGGNLSIPSFSAMRRAVSRWLVDQFDLLPPYRIYEGELWGKHVKAGRFYLELGGDAVEVDRVAYSVLDVGEALGVRYTRRLRAINIDRRRRDVGDARDAADTPVNGQN